MVEPDDYDSTAESAANDFTWSAPKHSRDGGIRTCPNQGGPGVIRARFRLQLPETVWVDELSTTFPAATFRLLTGVPRGDRALELGEIRATTRKQVVEIIEAIESHPDIHALERLHTDDHRAIAHYETVEQGLYELLWSSSLPPEFPLVVENGWLTFDLTATRAQFEAFGDALDASGRQYDLLSVVHTDAESSLLTDRQRECLTLALRRGYFEVPRDSTLSAIADELGVDTSTASETIRRATGRIVSQFLLAET